MVTRIPKTTIMEEWPPPHTYLGGPDQEFLHICLVPHAENSRWVSRFHLCPVLTTSEWGWGIDGASTPHYYRRSYTNKCLFWISWIISFSACAFRSSWISDICFLPPVRQSSTCPPAALHAAPDALLLYSGLRYIQNLYYREPVRLNMGKKIAFHYYFIWMKQMSKFYNPPEIALTRFKLPPPPPAIFYG